MAEINFGLLQNAQNGFQNALANGMRAGQAMAGAMQAREEAQQRNALSAYAANPTREGLGALARVDPHAAIAERGRFDQADQARTNNQRDQLPVITRLLEGVTAENYGQRVAMAQQYGMDVSSLPPQFDPVQIGNMQTMARAMQTPQGQEALSTAGKQAYDEGLQPGTPEFGARVTAIFNAQQQQTIPYQAGGNVITYNPVTGQATPLVQGAAAPTQGGAPQPGTIEDGYRFKGGNPADPSSWEAVGGGGGGVTSTFLDGL